MRSGSAVPVPPAAGSLPRSAGSPTSEERRSRDRSTGSRDWSNMRGELRLRRWPRSRHGGLASFRELRSCASSARASYTPTAVWSGGTLLSTGKSRVCATTRAASGIRQHGHALGAQRKPRPGCEQRQAVIGSLIYGVSPKGKQMNPGRATRYGRCAIACPAVMDRINARCISRP